MFVGTPGLAYLAVLPVLVIFCPLGLKRSHPYYKATTVLERSHPSYKATTVLERSHPSYKATTVLERSHPSYKATTVLKRSHPSYKATFSLQKGWLYKRGTTVFERTSKDNSCNVWFHDIPEILIKLVLNINQSM